MRDHADVWHQIRQYSNWASQWPSICCTICIWRCFTSVRTVFENNHLKTATRRKDCEGMVGENSAHLNLFKADSKVQFNGGTNVSHVIKFMLNSTFVQRNVLLYQRVQIERPRSVNIKNYDHFCFTFGTTLVSTCVCVCVRVRVCTFMCMCVCVC